MRGIERPLRPWAEAALLLAVGLLSAQEGYVVAGGTVLSPQVGAAVLTTAALAWRTRYPAVPAALATALAAALGAVLPLVVVLFSFASRGRLVAAASCATAAMVGNLLVQPQQSLWSTRSYGPVLLLVSVVALGMWASSRRRLLTSMTAQVEQLRVERELRAEHARLAERVRVASELHDALAHSLSVLALHTGALQRHSANLPPQVADRIDLLRATSTDALRDLRDVLGGLRAPDTDGAPGPRQLRELPVLLDEARAAGQQVEAEIRGTATALPFSHRLAIYRVVQEALTNARKHAPGSSVRVRVDHGPPESAVDVENTAGEPGSHQEPGGHGLLGLAERVDALHGRLEHGPSGAGGWRLTARIPVGDHTPEAT
ncbi:histidine kinase [Saccharopolyspora sp. NFXS83]|uniref:sensor histidine kinase n=1 Tax=Saccharopolyspora sp. NFXS83 TaxID=2993560 RepID=UPI00224AB1AC|nr:histidine kinase [Saccharopolyspora sp. NFXS83]MCX2734265.1 histidine kinase [Saccharopolyspora sp. NFXS83]